MTFLLDTFVRTPGVVLIVAVLVGGWLLWMTRERKGDSWRQ